MSTKNNPSAYDCYSRAEPDEPMFVLLGRDPMAGALVRAWAELRRMRGESKEKVAEACACASAMDVWAKGLGKNPVILEEVHRHAHEEELLRVVFTDPSFKPC